MDNLFTFSFNPNQIDPDIKNIVQHANEIDKIIASSAPEWPVDKIAKIDLAILRLAIYELTIAHLEPPKVIIDEAVELAHEFGNEHSSQFVNGVLGSVLKLQ
jgi:N utilization substance protein B